MYILDLYCQEGKEVEEEKEKEGGMDEAEEVPPSFIPFLLFRAYFPVLLPRFLLSVIHSWIPSLRLLLFICFPRRFSVFLSFSPSFLSDLCLIRVTTH